MNDFVGVVGGDRVYSEFDMGYFDGVYLKVVYGY